MLILSWNINGIRAVVKKGFTKFLENKKPDILGLQEVKIGDSHREKSAQGGPASGWDFCNNTEYWNSAKKPGYSGTMTLIKEKSQAQQLFIKHTTGLNIEKFDDEGRTQTLEFKDFYFVNCYFPNTRDDLSRLTFKQDFNDAFLKYIKKLDKKKPVIAVGDYNVAHEPIDIARPEPNEGNAGYTNEERAWMSQFTQAGFIDTFRHLHPKKVQYSWWSFRAAARARNVGWRIDYVLVSKRFVNKIKKSFIWDEIVGSDHCPVGIEIDL
ncbi:MAG: exodeoxyribonuclease III [Candidatus Magasanikbacteria bacterium CG_4_10_14_0_8_um_filter_32_14]|uniref:Exodeoxyribonuclease III n=2 Tax=Candidatus Magasanikiibacteriota TaxID=1752731 RepID=A0A2M7R9A4_9BACT|nr:MAG: exodeoxyribonuclease III [Candidatus Magasanikbacteria bacterium CG1_02_32_51]PIY93320.1 MAG: exodeoxyribonuclease III [Candidatus Magasanikbacteria bacterium CG_4_10_14_0_8_um_filter_32_14]